jgi:hypothetical protein
MLQIACEIKNFSSNTQQIARKSERLKLQNAANSTQIRDFRLQNAANNTQIRDFNPKM